MDPKQTPASVVLYMKINLSTILTQSRLMSLAELLLSVVQLFGVFDPKKTYGWIILNDDQTRWLALFEVPEGEDIPFEPAVDIKLPDTAPPQPRGNGFSADDLS